MQVAATLVVHAENVFHIILCLTRSRERARRPAPGWVPVGSRSVMSRGTTGSAGDQLRALREAKGMGLRDVESHSRKIAAHVHVDACFVSHEDLWAPAADCHKPGVYKLYTLSRLFGTELDSLLKLYGMGDDVVGLAELGRAR